MLLPVTRVRPEDAEAGGGVWIGGGAGRWSELEGWTMSGWPTGSSEVRVGTL